MSRYHIRLSQGTRKISDNMILCLNHWHIYPSYLCHLRSISSLSSSSNPRSKSLVEVWSDSLLSENNDSAEIRQFLNPKKVQIFTYLSLFKSSTLILKYNKNFSILNNWFSWIYSLRAAMGCHFYCAQSALANNSKWCRLLFIKD